MHNKHIIFVMKLMSGGGAERVISLLSHTLLERGYEVSLILTHQSLIDAKLDAIHRKVQVISILDSKSNSYLKILIAQILSFYARLLNKISTFLFHDDSKFAAILKYFSRNYAQIRFLKKYLSKNKKCVVISFLNDSIFYTLLASAPTNKIIISERGDPQQYIHNKTTMAFIRKQHPKAHYMVFQTQDALEWYIKMTTVNGRIIPNPVKPNLPIPYKGDRQKKIVNFCRISPQKNLLMLIGAFQELLIDYPDYELYIYGDPDNGLSDDYYLSVKQHIAQSGCSEKIHLSAARNNIHDLINDYAMFVSSSDYEGMSNSMLEAMAMGMPTICTDCPAGGARAVIHDHVNGLLVPVADTEALYHAMKKLIETPYLAAKISSNASKIRETLSVDTITNKWMELING